MRRTLFRILSLVAVVVLGVVVIACGKDDLNPEAVAQAAEKTRSEQSARIGFAVRASGFGLPQELTLRGQGVAALNASNVDLTVDLGPALALVGAGSSGETRIVALDGDLFVKPPSVDGFALPGGRTWVGVDVSKAIEATGVDSQAFGALVTVTPDAALSALKEAGRISKVGEDDIAGTTTTHYRGEVRLSDYLAALPEDKRAEAKAAIDDFLAQSGEKDVATPIDVWVDGDGRIRRMSQRSDVPKQDGVPAGQVAMTFDYSDFGAALTAKAPPKGDTFDATTPITDVLKQQGGLQAP